MTALHLASASPRRRELLLALGLEFTSAGVNIDESRLHGETVQSMVVRLAREKAAAAAASSNTIVIGADTMVVQGSEVFGKPSDKDSALRMLQRLSNRAHQVLTGVAVRSNGRVETAICVTDVKFREIGRDEALQYWQSGEPADKAGAYAIQGLGGAFVASISGSYSGVVGLPIFETVALLRNAGLDPLRAH